MTLSEQLTKSFGINSLWNVTHLSNLESLLSHGILCKNDVQAQSLKYKDISNRTVQSQRSPICDANYRIIFDPHDYVPLFFADNTPMLYVTSSPDKSVILLEISPEVADIERVCFSNANIAANDHYRYTNPSDLRKLDWGVIKSRSGAFWPEWKRKRSAEILIPQSCPPSFIKAVHVQRTPIDGVYVGGEVRAIVEKFPSLNINVHEDLTSQGVC